MLALLLGAAGCHRQAVESASTDQPAVLAEVGERRITLHDLEAEAARRIAARRPVPEKDVLIQEMVERAALIERARQAGLDQEPAIRQAMENVLIGRLMERELTPRREALQITPEAVRAAYEAELERHTRPAQVRLAILHLELDPKASPARRAETRSRMEEARAQALELPPPQRARGVAGFGPLAIRYSDDAVSRHRGGDIGWLDEGQASTRVPPEVVETGWRLAVGEVSEILETPTGFHLVMTTDRRDRTVIPFESVQAGLRQSLLVRGRKDLDEAFKLETARMVPSRVDTAAVAAVTLPVAEPLVARHRESQPPALPGSHESSNGY